MDQIIVEEERRPATVLDDLMKKVIMSSLLMQELARRFIISGCQLFCLLTNLVNIEFNTGCFGSSKSVPRRLVS